MYEGSRNRNIENNIPSYDKTYKDSDPGTCRLIRTASKASGEGSGGDRKVDAMVLLNYFQKIF